MRRPAVDAMKRRRPTALEIVGLAAGALAVGVVAGVGAAGDPVAPVTWQERDAIAGEARSFFDNPLQRLVHLSYRVERIPDPEPGPCDDKPFDGWTGTDDAAWHVTAFTIFGLRAGGVTITCSGEDAD